MSTPSDRRSRKRLATRQVISDTATHLFIERGFDQVTVDEIAAAADVGRMTVFNHFPRKEDMFFDLDEEGREILREALRQRDPCVAPTETNHRPESRNGRHAILMDSPLSTNPTPANDRDRWRRTMGRSGMRSSPPEA